MRAITWVVRVLAKPDRIEADRFDAALTHALGRIAERDGRTLRVVYNGSVNPPRIVTVYFDRRPRGARPQAARPQGRPEAAQSAHCLNEHGHHTGNPGAAQDPGARQAPARGGQGHSAGSGHPQTARAPRSALNIRNIKT